ncbi:MAG: hypothetical protein HIU87_03755 [Acidobacteria bacterium]|nr:hypothetical protein [Acidobacteriota bacterium]
MRAYYTVEVEGHSYVLTPAPSLSKAGVAFLTMGIGAAVFRNSALYGVLPGTPVKVSSEGNGTFYVKLGKRMSAYKLESAK